jgi:hypothetical protein
MKLEDIVFYIAMAGIVVMFVLITVGILNSDLAPENVKERIARESSTTINYIDEGKIFKYNGTYFIETSNGNTYRVDGYKE